jgi:hypothetical protein
VIGGTVLIGVGGLLTTLGWNTLASRDQQANALRSLVDEVELNEKMATAALDLARRWPQRQPQENFSYKQYHSTHVVAVLTSGALDPAVPGDAALLQSLHEYQEALADFNAGLRNVGRLNPGLFLKVDMIHVTDAAQWPEDREAYLSDLFRRLLAAHDRVRALLRDKGVTSRLGIPGARGAA